MVFRVCVTVSSSVTSGPLCFKDLAFELKNKSR